MKKFTLWIGLTLLVILLLGGIGWIYADQLLNGIARPQLEKLAATLLDGQVSIARLQRTDQGLEALDLEISTAQGNIEIAQLRIDFSLTSLWQRRLDKLLISKPRLRLTLPADQGQSATSARQLPIRPPLTIALIRITDGRLQINTPSHSVQFQQLNVSGSLDLHSPFSLTGTFGHTDQDQQPFSITGELQLTPTAALTIQSLTWLEQPILTAPLTLALADDGIDLQETRFTLVDFDSRQLQELFSALGQPTPLPKELSFSLNRVKIGFTLHNNSIQLKLAVATGKLAWKQFSGPFSDLAAVVTQSAQGWDINGQLSGPAQTALSFTTSLDNRNRLTGTAKLRSPDPGRLKQALFGGADLKISGGLQLKADFSLAGNHLELSTTLQGTPDNERNTADLFNISTISGQLKLALQDGKETFSLVLAQASHPLLTASGTFQDIKASLQIAELTVINQVLPPERIPAEIREASGINVQGRFTATQSGWTGQIGINLDKAVLAGLTLRKLTGRSQLRITADQLNFRELSATSEVAYGAVLNGRLGVTATADMSGSGYSIQLTRFSVDDLNYNSADGLSGVGAAALSVAGTITGDWPVQDIDLDLNGSLRVREVLAGVFYADLSQQQANFSLQGRADLIDMELTAKSLQIELPQVARLSAQGRLGGQLLKTKFNIEFYDMTNSYKKTIQPLLEGTWPQLTALDLSGAAALDVQLQSQATGWLVAGTLKLSALNARWNNDRIVIADGHGALPFIVGRGTLAEANAPSRQQGAISVQSLVLGPARLEQARVEILAERNRIALPSALRLQLADGTLAIEDVALAWNDDLPQGELTINIVGVNLESLTRELGLPVMQGSLSADLGKIRYSNRELSTAGVAGINVFDGRFQIGNMRLSQPFSSHPTFFADIDFDGLDLQQATRTFDFGEMNGILDGYIHGLQLYGATPAAFVASVSTRTAGTRNISVKALNNISILSQGGISAALSRGIYRFIDFYRYRKIAFDCSLVNDTFTLIGTALPDSKRYLVYGALLPPRIDITISTPTISFKEMLKRLSRIDRTSGKTANDTAPTGTGG
ncbi:hypothetical protein [Pelobacter seleniigenes]|uniref:hypothetical protein n=1 Tax=Pelobacter seleniigenes TaxID=407188 RepID=UPI0004A73D7A|nr:hypothetical protein [Pelobacter seleniigenes]